MGGGISIERQEHFGDHNLKVSDGKPFLSSIFEYQLFKLCFIGSLKLYHCKWSIERHIAYPKNKGSERIVEKLSFASSLDLEFYQTTPILHKLNA